MEKNGRIKKIGCLGAYSFVLFLFAFDCLYFWVSQKRQVVHYNKLTECFYGKHVTYLSGVYLWAYIFFILMPVVFFIFWKKKIRTVVLFALLFVLHVAVGTSFVIWLESMDNDGTYDGFGDFYRYEQQEPGGNWVLCIQEVYVSGSNPEESKQHNIIYVQTGYNTLKQVREYKFGPADYEVSWKNDRVQIFQELWNGKGRGQTLTEMRDITTYSVIQRFHDAPGVVNPFSLSGSQCILAKPQKKSIL